MSNHGTELTPEVLDRIEARAYVSRDSGWEDVDATRVRVPVEVGAVLALVAAARERDDLAQRFPCDDRCGIVDGPSEACSRHGRSPADLWRLLMECATERNELRALRGEDQ